MKALTYFMQRSTTPLQLELESALLGNAQISWEVHGLISEALLLLRPFMQVSLAHIYREFKRVVDWIVKDKSKNKLPQDWVRALWELPRSKAVELFLQTFI